MQIAEPSPKKSRYDYCFVVTYGRSGSTLMQGILNSIPGYCIRGENNAAMNRLYGQFTLSVNSATNFAPIAETPTDSWYGISGFNEEAFVASARELMLNAYIRPPLGARCVGFKEIRYDLPDLGGLLAFIERVFPNCCFVFHSRSLHLTARSGWWKEDEMGLDTLREIQKRISEVFWQRVEQGKNNMIVTRHEAYIEDVNALRDLFAFLGEPFKDDVVKRVLDVRHSA